jgi:hypothetical protein
MGVWACGWSVVGREGLVCVGNWGYSLRRTDVLGIWCTVGVTQPSEQPDNSTSQPFLQGVAPMRESTARR